MAREKKRKLSLFWLKLIGAYVILIALWPFVRPHYDRMLGGLTAIFIPILAIEETNVDRVALDDELRFFMVVRSEARQKAYNLKYHLDPHQYGYGHIMFTALAFAVPGWTFRKRLARWIAGALTLQAFFVFMVLLNLFSTVGSYGHEAWRGDLLTALIPGHVFLKYRDFLSLVSAQFVPILVWLALFVFTLQKSPFWPGPTTAKARK